MSTRIPKRIIQTAKSFNLPLLYKSAAANVQLLNPDFEYKFFDDEKVEAFLQEHFPQYRDVFYSFPFTIQRYDFFRYLAVYKYGDFYLDLDVFLASGLSRLLDFGCVFPFEELTLNKYLRNEYGMDWEIGNYAFGAEPGHPFIQAVIENCVRAQKDQKWTNSMMRKVPRLFHADFVVLNTTGPGLVSRTLAENPRIGDDVTVLFPDDLCDQRKWHCFGEFGVHLMDSSWRPKTGLIRSWSLRLWKRWTRRQMLRNRPGLEQIKSAAPFYPGGDSQLRSGPDGLSVSHKDVGDWSVKY